MAPCHSPLNLGTKTTNLVGGQLTWRSGSGIYERRKPMKEEER
jgi:hypothetical protein